MANSYNGWPASASAAAIGIAQARQLTPDQLAAVNPQVTDRNNLSIGQVLNLPK